MKKKLKDGNMQLGGLETLRNWVEYEQHYTNIFLRGECSQHLPWEEEGAKVSITSGESECYCYEFNDSLNECLFMS